MVARSAFGGTAASPDPGDSPTGSDERRATVALVLLALVLLAAWTSPVLFPLRILVVLFHECGHGLTAVVTGGEVLEIGLSPYEGGHALTRGGSRFLILNGGYLGSLAAGLILLVLSRVRSAARGLTATLGVAVFGVSLVLIRPFISFGFAYGVLAGMGLVLLGARAPAWLCWGFIRLVGVFSVFYALVDVRDDILSGRYQGTTDATMLADLTGIPAVVWGVGWVLAGVLLTWRLRRFLA